MMEEETVYTLEYMSAHFIAECPLCGCDGNSLAIRPETFTCSACNSRGKTKVLISLLESANIIGRA